MHTEGISYTLSESQKLLNNTTFQLKKYGIQSANVSVQVDFSPFICISNKTSQASTKIKSIPIFNTDKRFYTPSFIHQFDQKKYNQNQLFYKTAFQTKIQEMNQEKNQMFLPKPSKPNSFCCICKTIFQDYLTHINLPLHRTLTQMSDFQKDIVNICHKFQEQQQNYKPVKKQKRKYTKTKQVNKDQKPRKNKKIQLMKSCSTITDCTNSTIDSIKLQ